MVETAEKALARFLSDLLWEFTPEPISIFEGGGAAFEVRMPDGARFFVTVDTPCPCEDCTGQCV